MSCIGKQHSLDFRIEDVGDRQYPEIMLDHSDFQTIRLDNSAVLMEQIYRMKAKHSKPKSFPKRFSDPVQTQIYVHSIGESKGLPPIKDSYSFSLEKGNKNQKSQRGRNLTQIKSKRCETITYDSECASKFPLQNTVRNLFTERAVLKGKKFVEIDMLTLNTHYAKTKEVGIKQKIVAEEIKYSDLISIPSKNQIADFIKNYKVKNEAINVDELVKSPYFGVQFKEKVSLYFGNIRDGIIDGKGVMISKTWIFEGEWRSDQRLQGVEITEKGIYKGKFVNNQRTKVGQFFWKNGEYYSGQWLRNKKHGTGVWKSIEGDVYMGQWNKGKVEGYGIHLTKTGQKYQGYFHNFLKHGQGKEFFPNGDYFEGIFKQGKPQGFGLYKWKIGIIYQGQFKQGFRDGNGTIKKQGIEYQGTFRRQKAHGQGRLTVFNGANYVGQFKNGKKQGKGIAKQKRKVYVGIWKNNQFIQKME